jgi:hypothetical protein
MVHLNSVQPLQPADASNFHNGDKVVLAKGSYQGTPGTFLNFKDDDPKWADILEQDSEVRCHPVEWLQHQAQTGGVLCSTQS